MLLLIDSSFFYGVSLFIESRANLTPADIAEDDVGLRVLLRDESRVALGLAARTVDAAVEPVHELTGVVPDGEGEHHAAAERLAHGGQAAESLGVRVRGVARLRRDGVARGVGRRNERAILHVPPRNRCQRARRRAVVRVELRDHRERLRRIHRAARSVEVRVALRVGVQAATALVTIIAAARVRCERVGLRVRLQN